MALQWGLTDNHKASNRPLIRVLPIFVAEKDEEFSFASQSFISLPIELQVCVRILDHWAETWCMQLNVWVEQCHVLIAVFIPSSPPMKLYIHLNQPEIRFLSPVLHLLMHCSHIRTSHLQFELCRLVSSIAL